MVNIDKKTLDEWINIDNISYSEISRRLECSITYVKKYATKIGVKLPYRGKCFYKPIGNKKNTYICKNCGKEIVDKKYRYRKFCNNYCCAEYKKKEKYKYYLEHQIEFKGKEIKYEWLKPILLNEQNGLCKICGIGTEWNGKELHFIMDHIDGDATNNERNNLRLLCPNCDSQLDTYKARNIGHSTRKYKPYRIL